MKEFLDKLNWVACMSIAAAILMQLGNGSMSLAHQLPANWLAGVQEATGNLGSILALIVSAGAYGRVPAPSGSSSIPPTIVRIIIIAFVLSLMFPTPAAQAQILPKPRPAAASPIDQLQKLIEDISAKKVEIVGNVVAAIQEADDDAGALTIASDPTSFRDPIAHACYPAQIRFLQTLPQVQAIKAKVPYNLIVLFQHKRNLVALLKAGLPPYLKLGCSALVGDEKTILIQTLAMIGVSVGAGALTGIFPAAAPFTLPALAL